MSDGERQQHFLSASSVYTFRHIAACRTCLPTSLWTATFLRGSEKKLSATSECCNHFGLRWSFKACRRPLTSAKNTSLWCATGRVEEVRYRWDVFFSLFLSGWEPTLHQGMDFPRGASTCVCRQTLINAGESTRKQQAFSHPKDRLWHLWEGQG